MLDGAFETKVLIEFEKDKKTPSQGTIRALAEKHMERYQGRIKMAGKRRTPPFVNVEQCKHFLGLWTSMRAKSYDYTKFNAAEKGELNAAVVDEQD